MGSKKALCWQNTRYWTWKGEKRFLRKFTKKSYSHCLKITKNVSFEFFNFFLSKLTIFGIYNQLLSTQNVNVARFARNVEMRLFLWFSNTVNLLTVIDRSPTNYSGIFAHDIQSGGVQSWGVSITVSRVTEPCFSHGRQT